MGDLCAQGLDQAVETRRADRGKHRPVVRDRCVSFGSVANFAPRRGAPRAPHATPAPSLARTLPPRASYANVIDWPSFSVHMQKREVPEIASRLRGISAEEQQRMHEKLRRYKRAFVWWRPDGLAYEFTLAALGQRLAALEGKH